MRLTDLSLSRGLLAYGFSLETGHVSIFRSCLFIGIKNYQPFLDLPIQPAHERPGKLALGADVLGASGNFGGAAGEVD